MKIKEDLEKHEQWKKSEPVSQFINSDKFRVLADLNRKEIIITRKKFDSGMSDTNIYLTIEEAEALKNFLGEIF